MIITPVFQWGENFANKFDLDGYKTILDLGCRQGNISAHLAQKYKKAKFIAIDNIATEIQQAKNQYQLPNLTFETADALQLGCTEIYDAIVSFSCLHWIQSKEQVLKSIYQALKPGGKAFLQFFALHGRLKNDRIFYKTSRASKWKSYFRHFTPGYAEITASEFCTLLQNQGFVIHRLEFNNYKTDFANSDSLQYWFKSWVSHTRFLPNKKRDHFLNEAVQLYLSAHQYSAILPFPYHEYLLEVICEKPLLLDDIESKYQFANIQLTGHEASVLKYFLLGKTSKEIAILKTVSSKTVEFHLAKIKEKLNCQRRSEIYQAAYQYGFIKLVYDHKL